jgi:hypothetical protein
MQGKAFPCPDVKIQAGKGFNFRPALRVQSECF